MNNPFSIFAEEEQETNKGENPFSIFTENKSFKDKDENPFSIFDEFPETLEKSTLPEPPSLIPMHKSPLAPKLVPTFRERMQPEAFTRQDYESGIRDDAFQVVKDVAGGALGTVEGMAGFSELITGGRIGSDLANKAQEWRRELQPENPTFIDDLASGLGSSAIFFIPGMGVAKGTEAFMSVAPRLAMWLGTGISTSMEAATEAGQTYRDVMAESKGNREEAEKAAAKTFFLNIPTLALTNKLGVFSETGGILKKALTSAPLEGIQEGAQEIISSFSQDKPINWENVKRSAEVGAVSGALFGAGEGAIEHFSRGEKEIHLPEVENTPSIENKETQNLDEILTEFDEPINKPDIKNIEDNVVNKEPVTDDNEDGFVNVKPRTVKPLKFNVEKHSLTDFVRQQGGLVLSNLAGLKGEIKDHFMIGSGYGLVNNKTGISVDTMRELADGEGFNVPETDGDFFEMIKKDADAKVYDEPAKRIWHPAKQEFSEIEKDFYPPEMSGIYASTGKYNPAQWSEYLNKDRNILKLPEIVELATGLMNGKYPKIKEKIGRKAEVMGAFYPGSGNINLKAEIFKDPQQAASTLAHEIGHLVDWLPDKYISRGNLLGRIASLRKYMKEWEFSAGKGKKGMGKRNSEIREELKKLTQIIKPFDEKANSNFTKYRYSSVELYADAFTTLINNPKLLRVVAPTFKDGFLGYLNKKPEVKRLYENIEGRLQDSKAVFEQRQERVHAGYEKAEEARRKDLNDRQNEQKRSWKQELIDVNAPLIDKVKKTNVLPSNNPVYALEESKYANSQVKVFLQDIDEKVLNPLKGYGITPEDIADVMFHERVINERTDIANPHGFDPVESKKQLREIAKKAGLKKYIALTKSVKEFRKLRKEHILSVIEEAKMFDPALMQKIRDNDHYATFNVAHYLEGNKGAGSGTANIFKQIGTLSEIENPFTATIMKEIVLLKAAKRKIAADKTVKFMKEFFPGEIQEADRVWNGKTQVPNASKDPKLGMIRFMENGKEKGYYVDKYIAESFNLDPQEMSRFADLLRSSNVAWREVFVGKRPGFWFFNLIRDFKRAAINLPGMSISKLVPQYLKALKPAYREVFGIPEDVTREMNRKNMLISIESAHALSSEEKQLERLLQSYGVSERKWKNNVTKPIMKFWETLGNITEFTEKVPKIAGYRHLKEQGKFSEKEIGHIVRTQAGSPDFLRQGKEYSLWNNLLLFSNAAKEGWRGDIEAMKRDGKAYWFKRFNYSVMPKLLMLAISSGAMGDDNKEIMDSASEYQKTNYTVIPLGKTATGKGVVLTFPDDETGRFMSGIIWKLMNVNKERSLETFSEGLFDYMAGQAPTLTPSLKIPGDVVSYLGGRNPHDSFRGRPAIPKKIWEAGGKRRRDAFFKYLWNEAGGGIVYRFKNDNVEDIKTELEKIIGIPISNDIIGRFIRVTNVGERQELKGISNEVRQEEANRQLEVKEKILEAVNNGKTKAADVIKLWQGLKKDKLISARTTYKQFNRTFKRYASRRAGNPRVDAIIFAHSNKEKTALLRHYRKEMKKNEYNGFLRQLNEEGLISTPLRMNEWAE